MLCEKHCFQNNNWVLYIFVYFYIIIYIVTDQSKLLYYLEITWQCIFFCIDLLKYKPDQFFKYCLKPRLSIE